MYDMRLPRDYYVVILHSVHSRPLDMYYIEQLL